MSVEATYKLASKLLGISEDDAKSYATELTEYGLTYYSVPIKGGDSLIVSDEGEVLYANSSVNPDVHIQEYLKGRRTPLETFFD